MATFLTPVLIQRAHELIDANDNLEGFVPGEGSLTPKLVLVSEVPGAKETELSHGFQGPAGTELNQWLASLGISRDEIYMTGAIRARPFTETSGRKQNRRPTQAELKAFAPSLDHELAALPTGTLIVPLGNTGLQRLLVNKMKITQVHGELMKMPILRFHSATDQFKPGSRVYSLFHPSYVRRFPSKRSLVEDDLKMLKTLI